MRKSEVLLHQSPGVGVIHHPPQLISAGFQLSRKSHPTSNRRGSTREVKRAALEEMRSRYVVTLPSVDTADLQDLQRPVAATASPELFAQ
jgi:hypothetical protein